MPRLEFELPATLHRLAALAAQQAGQPLAEWIREAIDQHTLRQALHRPASPLAAAVREAYPEATGERPI